MNRFEQTVAQYWTEEYPSKMWSFLGSPEEAKQIPDEHKDQIHFLTEEGRKFIEWWIFSSHMQHGVDLWRDHDVVFNPHYFKRVDQFRRHQNDEQTLRKWLYKRSVPLSKYVFIEPWLGDQAIMLTWKMVIKYADRLFFSHDMLITDSTLSWGLFYYHEGTLSFGYEVHYNKEIEDKRVAELSRHIQEWNEKTKTN